MYKIYGAVGCSQCKSVVAGLEKKGIEFQYLIFEEDFTEEDLKKVTNQRSFPQITKIVDGKEVYIGGARELVLHMMK